MRKPNAKFMSKTNQTHLRLVLPSSWTWPILNRLMCKMSRCKVNLKNGTNLTHSHTHTPLIPPVPEIPSLDTGTPKSWNRDWQGDCRKFSAFVAFPQKPRSKEFWQIHFGDPILVIWVWGNENGQGWYVGQEWYIRYITSQTFHTTYTLHIIHVT